MKDRNSKMTVEDLEAIDKLMCRGFEAKEIHDVIKRSLSGIHNYMRLLKFVKKGKPFCMSPSRYCADVLNEYAEKHGYKKPVNTFTEESRKENCEQIAMTEITEPKITNMLAVLVCEISDKLRELSTLLEGLRL